MSTPVPCEMCERPSTWSADCGAGGVRVACDLHHAEAVKLAKDPPPDVDPIPESWWRKRATMRRTKRNPERGPCRWDVGTPGHPRFCGAPGTDDLDFGDYICPKHFAEFQRIRASRRVRPNFIPDGVTDALSAVDWKSVKGFPGGPRGFVRYAIDGAARKVGLRKNPALILVHGNPRPPAEIERAWMKFHETDEVSGPIRDIGRIPGTPDYTFALGRCVDVNLGRGWQKFTPRPWLVFSPKDESLWIVAEKPLRLGNGVAGSEVHGVTYDPPASSAKDPAKYRHEFNEPRPTFSPVGNPNYCRAILLDGGSYYVDDWVRD